jgi:hypothetical protein
LDEFSLWTIWARIFIVTHSSLLPYLYEHKFHLFTLYTRHDKPIKTAIRHLHSNISSEDTTLASRGWGSKSWASKILQPNSAHGRYKCHLPGSIHNDSCPQPKSQSILKSHVSPTSLTVGAYRTRIVTTASVCATSGSTTSSAQDISGVGMATMSARRIKVESAPKLCSCRGCSWAEKKLLRKK